MAHQETKTTAPQKPDWELLPPEPLPRPTYWPAVLALGVVFFAWGFITSLIISGVGLILLATGLAGWIGEMRYDE